VIELYAIAAHPGPPVPEPLHEVPAGDLAAICAPAEEGEVTADVLWRHEQLVEALMEDRDLLPVRFGTRLADDAAVARSVEEQRVELALALERVRGAVELSVRAVLAEPVAAPEDPEDYLRAKRRSAALQDTVHQPLAALARADVRRAPHADGEVLRAAYLVERGAVRAFTKLVARLDERHPELRLLCTGPWPPYSFAAR
jgi:hypothetical protein